MGGLDDWRVMQHVSSESLPLEAVYRSSWLGLTRLAFLLVGDRNEGEDIVQSVFTTAAGRSETINEPATYLRRAVVNRASDVHRRSLRAGPKVVVIGGSVDRAEVDEVWGLVEAFLRRSGRWWCCGFTRTSAWVRLSSLLARPASTVRSDLRRALTKSRGLMRAAWTISTNSEPRTGPSLRLALQRPPRRSPKTADDDAVAGRRRFEFAPRRRTVHTIEPRPSKRPNPAAPTVACRRGRRRIVLIVAACWCFATRDDASLSP